jgi:hypothetical protein
VHVVNLANVAVMGHITKIAVVENTNVIWEYVPELPNNCVLGGAYHSSSICTNYDVIYQPLAGLGAGEAESTFATMGTDDVAIDIMMDTEVGYTTEDESSDVSEEDLDDSI